MPGTDPRFYLPIQRIVRSGKADQRLSVKALIIAVPHRLADQRGQRLRQNVFRIARLRSF